MLCEHDLVSDTLRRNRRPLLQECRLKVALPEMLGGKLHPNAVTLHRAPLGTCSFFLFSPLSLPPSFFPSFHLSSEMFSVAKSIVYGMLEKCKGAVVESCIEFNRV